MMTRRAFAALATTAVLRAQEKWIELFNGRDLEGWRPSESTASWSVKDGALAAAGPRSHLFYTGRVNSADFKNFELEVEALAKPLCNSGVYFHTAYQERGFPNKGFEIQINNTADGEGSYRERKKTGSLYGLRNMYKQLVPDDQWFKINVQVRGKNIQVRVNSMLTVDYTEPIPAIVPAGGETERFLSHGTFALQCHNDGSHAFFRSVRVRPLADDLATPGAAPVVDEMFRKVIDIGRHNVPMVDYDVNLKPGLNLKEALQRSRKDGIQYGITMAAGNDAAARKFAESLRNQPAFVGLRVEGREWPKTLSRGTVALFDYILGEGLKEGSSAGANVASANADQFMDELVNRTVAILQNEPIDIYANPTLLPPQIAKDYDRLWTEERIAKVIDAAAKNQVALELADRTQLPGAKFILMAKQAKCKFAFGTGNSGANDLRRCDYGIRMFEECKLGWQDMFVPGAFWPRALERKGELLKG